MEKTKVKSPGARRGRPALKPGSPKRSSINTRYRAETKQRLEAEAQNAGRSLSEEIEFRLDQSFRDADTLVEALGGRDTYDGLRVLGSVAAQIKTRTGKTVADEKTRFAILFAWKRLVIDWASPVEWIADLERLSDEMPDAPKRPETPARGGLLVPPASEAEWEDYREKLLKFEKDQETFFIAFDEYKDALGKIKDEVMNAVGVGEEVLGLLSDQEKWEMSHAASLHPPRPPLDPPPQAG